MGLTWGWSRPNKNINFLKRFTCKLVAQWQIAIWDQMVAGFKKLKIFLIWGLLRPQILIQQCANILYVRKIYFWGNSRIFITRQILVRIFYCHTFTHLSHTFTHSSRTFHTIWAIMAKRDQSYNFWCLKTCTQAGQSK